MDNIINEEERSDVFSSGSFRIHGPSHTTTNGELTLT